MGEVRTEGGGGVREAIMSAIASEALRPRHGQFITVKGGTVVDAKNPAHIEGWQRIELGPLADAILAAIEPLIEQKGPAAQRTDDEKFFSGRPFPFSIESRFADKLEDLSDQIGDLESWRETTRERFNQTTTDLGLILRRIDDLERRADAFDLKHVASINRDKDINNAIERIEGRINAPAPEGAQPNPGILGDGLDRRFDEVVMNHPEVQIDKIRIAAERAMQEIVKIAELKAMNLGPNTFNMALREWRYSQ